MENRTGKAECEDAQLDFRAAASGDAPRLAVMNRQLILDEGHRNRMTLPELEERMREWLSCEYRATIFYLGDEAIGYALYRAEPDWIHLRQFHIQSAQRRHGYGTQALGWLKANPWKDASRIRTDVLIDNPVGIAFWRSVGFQDYCLTMELENGRRTAE